LGSTGTSGTHILVWSRIDVEILTEPAHSKCSPDGVRDAVLAAFHGHVDAVMIAALPLGEHTNPAMHKACVAYRIAVVDQALAYIDSIKPSESHTSAGKS
jgi:hypothetical protein